MSPLSHGLDASLFAGSTTAGSAPLDLVSSDKRLEVRIFSGSLDLSQATSVGGGKPSGSLALTLTELHGLCWLLGLSVRKLASFLVKTGEMRVQSRRFLLNFFSGDTPFFTKESFSWCFVFSYA
jgi:hypothetical protein